MEQTTFWAISSVRIEISYIQSPVEITQRLKLTITQSHLGVIGENWIVLIYCLQSNDQSQITIKWKSWELLTSQQK